MNQLSKYVAILQMFAKITKKTIKIKDVRSEKENFLNMEKELSGREEIITSSKI